MLNNFSPLLEFFDKSNRGNWIYSEKIFSKFKSFQQFPNLVYFLRFASSILFTTILLYLEVIFIMFGLQQLKVWHDERLGKGIN